jgi:hypothetical protein
MKLIKVTRQGNFHFLLDDGREAGIYPQTKYIRISTSQVNPFHERLAMIEGKKPRRVKYQMKEKFDTTEQMLKRLYEYNAKNCQITD